MLALATVAGLGLAACGGGGGGALSTLTGAIGTRTSGLTRTTTTAVTTTVQTAVPPATTGEASSSEKPWGWIALGVGLGLAALAIGLWAWHRRRSGAEAWGARTADLNRRTLVALDAVVAQGSIVTGQMEALASEARRSSPVPRTAPRGPPPPTCAPGSTSSLRPSRPTGRFGSALRRRARSSLRTRPR
jgi:hypothetical protein